MPAARFRTLPRRPRLSSPQAVAHLAAAGLLLAASGCREHSRQADRLICGGTISFIGPSGGGTRWDVIKAHARQAVSVFETLRFEAALPPEAGPTGRATAFRQAVADGAVAVCVMTPDTRSDDALLKAAGELGVPLVTVGAGPYRTPAFGHVEIAWADGAADLGRRLTETLHDHRSYAVMHHADGPPVVAECYNRFMQFARRQRMLSLLADITVAREPGEARAEVGRLFAKFPNLAVVVTLDENIWTPAALEQLPPAARIVTLGASPELWPLLESGRANALCGPVDAEVGQAAMELAFAALTESSRSGALRVIPCEIVTRDNLDDFVRRYDP